MRYELTVIGGGIVGLATAHQVLKKHPGTRLLLLEKEAGPAYHQTGHNSGVIHSGIYYTPGSLKAQYAKRGGATMVEFCRQHKIAHELCGKVVVATMAEELPRLEALLARSRENGILVNRLTPDQLKEREPHVFGIAALEVPSAGIANYPAVAAKLAELIQEAGGEVRYNCALTGVTDHTDYVSLLTRESEIESSNFITCAGLQSDLIARMSGARVDAHIVPFRGEYYSLKPEARKLIRHLVYPLPNPAFPFLGVHFTRMVSGEIHAGPNAVLALKREGYKKTDFSLLDVLEMLAFPGFRRMAAKNWREGLNEMKRSFSRRAFLTSLQRLVPEIRDEDIEPSPAGVRAMALLPNGSMVDDFLVIPGPRALHVCNAPSPAATASLEIGEYVAGLAREAFGL
jgi:L-2-hydroxyglutarate oxidase